MSRHWQRQTNGSSSLPGIRIGLHPPVETPPKQAKWFVDVTAMLRAITDCISPTLHSLTFLSLQKVRNNSSKLSNCSSPRKTEEELKIFFIILVSGRNGEELFQFILEQWNKCTPELWGSLSVTISRGTQCYSIQVTAAGVITVTGRSELKCNYEQGHLSFVSRSPCLSVALQSCRIKKQM